MVARRPLPARLSRLGLVLLGVLTAGVFGLALWVALFGRRERARRAEALVVLGALVQEGGRPSPALRARTQKAVALYHRGVAPLLLLSGGVGRFPPSEARVALGLAQAAGVPASACLLEEESHSTHGNAVHSVRLLRVRGLTRVVVVSDGFHLLRARQAFRRQGLEVATSPASRQGRALGPFDALYWTVREAFTLLLHPRLLLARAPRQARRWLAGQG